MSADRRNTPLARLRKKLGKTQVQMAKEMGLSQAHYSRVERIGESSPARAARIAAKFPGLITEMEVLYPGRFDAPGAQKPRPPTPKREKRSPAVAEV